MRYAICNETFEGWDHGRVCAAAAPARLHRPGDRPVHARPADHRRDGRTAARRLRRQAEDAGLTIIGLHWLLAKTEGLMLTSPDAGRAAADRRLSRRIGPLLPRPGRRLDGVRLAATAADPAGSYARAGRRLRRGHVSPALPDDRRRRRPPLPGAACAAPEADFLNTCAEAVEMLDRIDHPNFVLHLDVKAMSSEDGADSGPDPPTRRPAPAISTPTTPTAAAPASAPPIFGRSFGRCRRAGYSGWVSVEVFDYTPDPETIARESIRYMRECEDD